jgi:hypothetical protein
MQEMNSELSIERFHSIATLSLADLSVRHGQDLVSWLKAFVQAQLIDIELPSIDTPESFFEAMKMLSENKRAWSQRLGALVIDQVDSDSPEDRAAASDQLHEFSQTCPWKFLRQSAASKTE